MLRSPVKKKMGEAGARAGIMDEAREDTIAESPDAPVTPAVGPADAPPVTLEVDPSEDSDMDRDWCEEEEQISGSDSDSESSSDEGVDEECPRGSTLAHLVEDHFFEDRQYAPLQLTALLQDVTVRDVRHGGVEQMEVAIQRTGWVRSSLMIAHDRENGRPPVLLEGAHRARALIQLYSRPSINVPLEKDLKVTVKILKGLSPSQEKQIGRESNALHSESVKMTLVDQVVAMWHALQTCREEGNFSPDQKKIPIRFLLHTHPDYTSDSLDYVVTSSVRRYKQLAEGFGEEAMRYMRVTQKSGDHVFPESGGAVWRAFSTTTLLDSRVVKVLADYPGPQLWYLRRVVELEGVDDLKNYDAGMCKDLAHFMRNIANLCEDFAVLVDKKCPRLSRFGRALRALVHTGSAKIDPEIQDSDFARYQVALFDEFAEAYLYKNKHDTEWKEIYALHKDDDRFYSMGLQKLLADTCFEGKTTKVDDALDFSRDCFFYGAPKKLIDVATPGELEDLQPPRKKEKKEYREEVPENERTPGRGASGRSPSGGRRRAATRN